MSAKNKSNLASWLKGEANPLIQADWDRFFFECFSGLFGLCHLSVACARRSIQLSVLILAIALTYWWHRHPQEFNATVETLKSDPSERWGFIGVFFLACIVDFFSLWKTRLLLTNVLRLSRSISILGVVLVDAILTSAFFASCYVVSETLWEWMFIRTLHTFGTLYTSFADLNVEIMWRMLTASPPISPFPIPLLWLCAMMTSAWLWLYILVGMAIRATQFFPRIFLPVSTFLDLDHHPMKILGLAAGVMAFMMVQFLSLFSLLA
jgi:hypothetical protein